MLLFAEKQHHPPLLVWWGGNDDAVGYWDGFKENGETTKKRWKIYAGENSGE